MGKKSRKDRRNWADRRSERTSLRERTAQAFKTNPTVEGQDMGSVMPGFTMWAVGPTMVVMPTLLADAPREVVALYGERIMATAVGTCRICGGVVTDHRTGLLGSEVFHDEECPVLVFDTDPTWLDPRAAVTMRGES